MTRKSPAGLMALTLALCGICCDKPASPAGPLGGNTGPGPAADLQGAWIGQYEETSCTGSCLPCCSMRFKAGALQRGFRLTLEQQNANVRGQFAELPVPNRGSLAGPVAGTTTDDRLNLAGNLSWVSADDPELFRYTGLQDFTTSLDDGGRSMTGTFLFADKASDGNVFMRRACRILRLERVTE